MEVIDVAIVGGPDLAAVVERDRRSDATVVRISIANGGPVPARLQRVAIPIESPPVQVVLAPGWEVDDAGVHRRLAGVEVSGPVVATDRGTVGWLGATHHRGDVVVQRDGWLLTAWADVAGVLLGPGEALTLDELWVGGPQGADDGLATFAGAWAQRLGAPRPIEPLTGLVVGGGAGPIPLEAAFATATRLGIDDADLLLIAAAERDLPSVASAAEGRGARFGVTVAPFGSTDEPVDTTRPGALHEMQRTGERLAAGGATWVVVLGAAGAATPRPRWGDASSTPVASLRAALAALRLGLGPGPVVHVAGGPPAALGGVAEVVDTGPGWPQPDPLAGPIRRAPFDRLIWAASPGRLSYDTPPTILQDLRQVSGPRVLWPSGAPRAL